MKKDCVFYHQDNCKFKQKELGNYNCLLCNTYYVNNINMDIKDWFIIANTNKNVRTQMLITIFALCLSAYVVYERQVTINKFTVIQKEIQKLKHKQKEAKIYNDTERKLLTDKIFKIKDNNSSS